MFPDPKWRSHLAVPLLSLAIPAGVMAQTASRERIDDIAQRGAQVMPFDLRKTQHTFTKTPEGGLQQVLARVPSDAQQIQLIRTHLGEIAQAFGRGDFSDPANIHGAAMPGLAELRAAKPGQLGIVYRDLPIGGEIAYNSNDPGLVAAVHRWFDAQLMDHGPDAMPGPHHGNMHHP